jgi:hypothetical protein
LLLLNLLSHDCPSHLLLHLNYGLGVEETIGEIKDVLTLQEEGHQSALIRLREKVRLHCLHGEDLIAAARRVIR